MPTHDISAFICLVYSSLLHAFKLGNPCAPAQDSTNHSQDSMCGVMGQRKLVFPMGLPHLPTSLYA